MNFSINAPQKQGFTKSAWVWFEGSTALNEGQAVCYNWDYGTAASIDARRTNRVELPAILNAPYFAGVAARAYSANTGGQLIEIFLPGSTCNVWSCVANTIGTGVSTFEVGTGGDGAGFFGRGGFPGKGTVTPLQTIDRGTPGLCLAYLHEGPQSGGIEVVTPSTDGDDDITLMVGGVTYLIGTVAIANSNAAFTVADGTYSGQKKAIVCEGTFSTSLVEIDFTSAQHADGSTALVSADFNADKEEIALTWHSFDENGMWIVDFYVGCDIHAS